jgi:ribosome-associated toxin RatA of RatAB toxin-antitoxin module
MNDTLAQVQAVSERVIAVSADELYRLIADYREHHPAFLPSAFSDLIVEEGGVGDGTVISVSLRLGGQQRRYQARVAETAPGRVLTETDLASGSVMTLEL